MKQLIIILILTVACQKTENRVIIQQNYFQDGEFRLTISTNSVVESISKLNERNQLCHLNIKVTPFNEELKILKAINIGNEYQAQSKDLNRYINYQMKDRLKLISEDRIHDCIFYNVESTGYIDNSIRINCAFEISEQLDRTDLFLNFLGNPLYSKDLLIPIRLSNLN